MYVLFKTHDLVQSMEELREVYLRQVKDDESHAFEEDGMTDAAINVCTTCPSPHYHHYHCHHHHCHHHAPPQSRKAVVPARHSPLHRRARLRSATSAAGTP